MGWGSPASLLHLGGERITERPSESASETQSGLSLEILEVPMFPHCWEFLIYSSWSQIQHDRRHLLNIFKWFMPTNEDKEDRTCAQKYSIKWFPLLPYMSGFLAPTDETILYVLDTEAPKLQLWLLGCSCWFHLHKRSHSELKASFFPLSHLIRLLERQW